MAALITLAFLLATQVYWVPVTRGGDRNGYLLGGRMLAEGQVSITPADEYVFLGPHWVTTDGTTYELKYPLGLPAVYAVVHWLFGAKHWVAAAHEVSPIAAALAVWGSFLLMRPIVGSLHALLGMILVASSPLTFFFANLPNSHASALCAAVWGMVCLLEWWRSGKMWLGIAAGLILGFDFTIRYTEGLLVVPLLLAVCFVASGDRRAWMKASVAPLAWLVPVASLLSFNLLVLHHFSGYAMTHESTAFSIHHFTANWRTMLAQIYQNGIWFLLPVAALGLGMMVWKSWRLGTVMCLWIVPTILVYTAYYWTPGDEPGLSYARFTLTVLPGLALAAMWVAKLLPARMRIIAAIIVAIVTIADLWAGERRVFALREDNIGCLEVERQVMRHIPAGSVVFAEQQNIPMLQVAGDWRLYLSDLFTTRYIQNYANVNPDRPASLQSDRAKELVALLGGKSDSELAAEENRLMINAIGDRRQVFVVLDGEKCEQFRRRYLDGRHWRTKVISNWTEPTLEMNMLPSPMQIMEVEIGQS